MFLQRNVFILLKYYNIIVMCLFNEYLCANRKVLLRLSMGKRKKNFKNFIKKTIESVDERVAQVLRA